MHVQTLWTQKDIQLSKTVVSPDSLRKDEPYDSTPACIGLAVLEERYFVSDSYYRVAKILVELIGIEPTTSGLQSPRSPS